MSREYCIGVLAELCYSAFPEDDQNVYFKYERTKQFKLLPSLRNTDIKKLLTGLSFVLNSHL
jgi:hypothetical protein